MLKGTTEPCNSAQGKGNCSDYLKMNGFVYENLFPNTGMSITNIFCHATEKKTKQNKKILSLSAQCFGFSVYSYPTRC